MNILILNWRDIKNPDSGGAELLTHELAKRWVTKGHRVTQFCAAFKGSKKEEIIDGVKFIRRGSWWNVHVYAFFSYTFRLKKTTDIVIDEVHWFPFFSALYAPDKTIALTCEVASKLFFEIFPYLVALFWVTLERIYLYAYKNVPTMVISKSTYQALCKLGINKEKIIIIPMGISVPQNLKLYPKALKPTVICLGRLNKQKGTIDAVEAFYWIKKEVKESQLWLVGSGTNEYVSLIKKKIAVFNLQKSVLFFGMVSELEKFKLLSESHVIIVPSRHEGWGLIVPEAGIVKTPAVVYDVPGLRDIVVSGKNGYVVPESAQAMGKKVVSLLSDKREYRKLSMLAYHYAKNYNWNISAEISLKFIQQ